MDEKTVRDLSAKARHAHATDILEDTVSEYFALQALSVNEEGVEAQITLLGEAYGEEHVRALLAVGTVLNALKG